jgi:hypothetical protein
MVRCAPDPASVVSQEALMQYPAAINRRAGNLFLSRFERVGWRSATRSSWNLPRKTVRKIKWPKRTIEVALSTSLLSPGANIKPDSDVVGAARRALARWSSLSNINFIVTWSSSDFRQSAEAGDGVSLLTIAATPENEAFNSEATTGRTRVFFDPKQATSPKPTSASIRDRAPKMELSFSFPLTARPAPTISKRLSRTRLDTCSAWTTRQCCRRRCRDDRRSTARSACRHD